MSLLQKSRRVEGVDGCVHICTYESLSLLSVSIEGVPITLFV